MTTGINDRSGKRGNRSSTFDTMKRSNSISILFVTSPIHLSEIDQKGIKLSANDGDTRVVAGVSRFSESAEAVYLYETGDLPSSSPLETRTVLARRKFGMHAGNSTIPKRLKGAPPLRKSRREHSSELQPERNALLEDMTRLVPCSATFHVSSRVRHSPARLNGYYSDIATRVFEPATTLQQTSEKQNLFSRGMRT